MGSSWRRPSAGHDTARALVRGNACKRRGFLIARGIARGGPRIYRDDGCDLRRAAHRSRRPAAVLRAAARRTGREEPARREAQSPARALATVPVRATLRAARSRAAPAGVRELGAGAAGRGGPAAARRGRAPTAARRARPRPAPPPRRRVEHALPDARCTCPACGARLVQIGEETSEQLDYQPASLFDIEHVRFTYACHACEGTVVTAELPAAPIEKGRPGPGL